MSVTGDASLFHDEHETLLASDLLQGSLETLGSSPNQLVIASRTLLETFLLDGLIGRNLFVNLGGTNGSDGFLALGIELPCIAVTYLGPIKLNAFLHEKRILRIRRHGRRAEGEGAGSDGQWTQVFQHGFQVQVFSLFFKRLRGKLICLNFPKNSLEYQISHSSWVGDYLDPTTFLDNFVGASGNNRTGFADARYEELLQWAATCGDPVLRLELLAEAERLLLDQAVILPLLVDVDMALVAEDLKGLTPNAAGIIDWAALHP